MQDVQQHLGRNTRILTYIASNGYLSIARSASRHLFVALVYAMIPACLLSRQQVASKQSRSPTVDDVNPASPHTHVYIDQYSDGFSRSHAGFPSSTGGTAVATKLHASDAGSRHDLKQERHLEDARGLVQIRGTVSVLITTHTRSLKYGLTQDGSEITEPYLERGWDLFFSTAPCAYRDRRSPSKAPNPNGKDVYPKLPPLNMCLNSK